MVMNALVCFFVDEFQRRRSSVVFPVDFIGVDLGEDEGGVERFLHVAPFDGRQ